MPRFCLLCLLLLPFLLPGCEHEESDAYTSEFFEAAAPAGGDGYLLAGRAVRTDGGSEDADGYLVRLNNGGATLWEHSYDLGRFGSLLAVRAQVDGAILGAGVYRAALAEPPLFVLKTAADGALTWRRELAVDSLTAPTAARATADGGFLFAGMTQSPIGSLRLVKCDAEANVTLDRTYRELANLTCSDALETADGRILLLCRLLGANRLYLIQTGAGGDTLWTRALNAVNSVNVRDVLAALPSGEIAAATAHDFVSAGNGTYDIQLVRTSAGGEPDTAVAFTVSDTQVPLAMAGLADNGVIIAGLTRPETATSQDFFIVRVAATGTAVFTRTYTIATADRATFVLPGTDGGFLFGGYTTGTGGQGFDGCALKIDGNGTLEWQHLYGQ